MLAKKEIHIFLKVIHIYVVYVIFFLQLCSRFWPFRSHNPPNFQYEWIVTLSAFGRKLFNH